MIGVAGLAMFAVSAIHVFRGDMSEATFFAALGLGLLFVHSFGDTRP